MGARLDDRCQDAEAGQFHLREAGAEHGEHEHCVNTDVEFFERVQAEATAANWKCKSS